jgi:hypothetical protein
MNYKNVIKAISALGENVREIDQDDILERLGLERRRGAFERVITAVGLFGAGMVVGAGVGMLASPMAPADMRKKITDGAKSVKKELTELVSAAEEQVQKGTQRVEARTNDRKESPAT